MSNYLYLLQEVEDFNTNIYKIGRTTLKNAQDRIKGYPVGSKIYRFDEVDDCVKRENYNLLSHVFTIRINK